MRYALLLAAGAALLCCAGCSDLISLNGFAPDGVAALNPRLPGVWGDDDDLYVVQEKGGEYSITVTSKKTKGETMAFTATLFRVGNAEILDLVPAGDDDAFRVAVHTPVRIWVDERSLRFTFLDSKWIRERAAEQALAKQQVNDKRTLLTGPSEQVTKFMLAHAGDDRAYENKPNELTRQ